MSKKIAIYFLFLFVLGASVFSVTAQDKKKNEAVPTTEEISTVNNGATIITDQTNPVVEGELSEFDPGLGAGGAHHIFPYGECTQFAADAYRDRNQKNITFRGNAKDWLVNARTAGYRTSTSKSAIVPNSIIVLGAFKSSSYGHVMIVDQIRGTSVLVSESNWVAHHKQSQRWITFKDLDRYNFQGVILP